jgi:protein-tyrosine phosphatase
MNNIKTVITAATGLKVTYPKDIEHRIFHLYDCETEKISRFFDEAFTIISEGLEKGNVYVHCFAGISRSSTIVISYLMKKYGWSLAEAYSLTKKKRKYVDPNPGFMRELRRYEKQLKNSTC